MGEILYGRVEDLAELARIHKDSERHDYVLDEVTRVERQLMEICSDPITMILAWIIESMTRAERFALVTPPPIVSRCYQELSDGSLGFREAYKVAAVPYPLALAQIMYALRYVFVFLMPLMIHKFTQDPLLTPVLASLIGLGYLSINIVAIELENPFGRDANDVPLVDQHEQFLEDLFCLFYSRLPL